GSFGSGVPKRFTASTVGPTPPRATGRHWCRAVERQAQDIDCQGLDVRSGLYESREAHRGDTHTVISNRTRERRKIGIGVAMAAALLTAVGSVATANASSAEPDTPDQPSELTESGSITVTDDGAVIDALHVRGSIAIQADNVTIKNTTVTYGGYHSIRIYPGATGTLIQDTKVDCLDPERTNGIVFGGYTAERVDLEGCRNDFMSNGDNATTVTDSTVDGEPFEMRPADTEPTPEPEETAEPEPTPEPEETAEPEPTPEPEETDPVEMDGDWPTPETTGPRYTPESSTGSLTSTSDGQVIERTTVNGRLTVRHDNVVVRDVLVNGTGTYMIQVLPTADGSCPTNVRFEYVEV